MTTSRKNAGGAEPGTSMGNQGSDAGPATSGGATTPGKTGGGQQRSKERGVSTNNKKQPGKRPRQGGSSA